MATYTQTRQDIIKSVLVFVGSSFLPGIALFVCAYAVLLYMLGFDLFKIIAFSMTAILLFFGLATLVMYKRQTKFYTAAGSEVEITITDDAITIRVGAVRNEIPYTLIKKAFLRWDFLIVTFISGGTIILTMHKLDANERDKLLLHLGVSLIQESKVNEG